MIQLFKAKSLKKTRKIENISLNERTQEKAILKEGIGTNREATCTRRGRTRASLFGAYTPSKMGFAVRGSKKQRGRSMVEMLGVLAIIGVLSIGGIQGYTMAMRKYRANEILNLVSKYAMVLYSGCQQAMEQNPEKYGVIREGTGYKSDIEDMQDFWYCPGIRFIDAGLGNMPNGVIQIGWMDTDTHVIVDADHEYMSGDATPGGVSIKSLSSGDAVVMTVRFETKELCETAMSVTGRPVFELGTYGASDNACVDNVGGFTGYFLAVTTMMN